MSKYIERFMMTVSNGSWERLMEFERKFTIYEANLGGIPRKNCSNHLVPLILLIAFNEREWDSLAEMEEAGEKMKHSPENKEITDKFISSGVANSFHRELLQIQNPLK